MGGACTLLSLVAFSALSTVLILQNVYANVAVQTALNTLLTSNPFSPAVKFAAPVAGSPLSPTLRGGVQVRVFGQGGLGCGALAVGHTAWELPPGAALVDPSSHARRGRSSSRRERRGRR